MKKILLFSAPALIFSGTVMAQTSYKAPVFSDKNVTKVMAKASKYGAATGMNDAGTGELRPQERSTTVSMVGTSTYQLQTNAAVQNRIVANADGTISAGYTFSNTSSWSDRGTGYVYNNGSTWSTAPTTRIESVRTGWPSVMVLGDNSEVVICHSSTNLYMSKRATKGTGAWTGSTAISSTAPYGSVWPRAINGGSDGKTIHMIALSNPTDGAATPTDVFFHGQQGCLTYSRSLDGGTTWDKLHTIPHEHDSTYYRGFGGDSYAIDARGTTVAYVVGGILNDLFLMKSMDNGNTWTKTNIMNFPIPFFNDQLTDTNSDGTIDTLKSNDGNVALLIDETNTVHVMFGRMRMLNDDTTDGLYSYFPGTSGLMYWNDNTGGSPVQIADLEDVDGDGTINITSNGWGTYQNSLTSFAHMGTDASNNIHVTYAGLVENTDPLGGGKAVRNIYYFSSSDHGANWTTPVRVNANDIREQVWSSVAKNSQPNCIKMIYQEDDAPGHGTTSTNADYSDNVGVTAEEYYVCFDPSNGIAEAVKLSEGMSLYPNPASTEFTVTTINSITKVEIFNSLGKLVATHTPNSTSARINVSNLSKGLYVVNVYNGNQKISKMLAKN